MSNLRRFQLDELALRPGTYFNPQTEIMVVVDDSPEVDHELFEADEYEASDWVQISEEMPIDENRRDGLVEAFQLAHAEGGTLEEDGLLDDEDEDDDLDEHDEEELEEL